MRISEVDLEYEIVVTRAVLGGMDDIWTIEVWAQLWPVDEDQRLGLPVARTSVLKEKSRNGGSAVDSRVTEISQMLNGAPVQVHRVTTL